MAPTLRKLGFNFKLKKAEKLSIKRKISTQENNSQKVTIPKIHHECNLNVSSSTVQRHLKKEDLKYKKVIQKNTSDEAVQRNKS